MISALVVVVSLYNSKSATPILFRVLLPSIYQHEISKPLLYLVFYIKFFCSYYHVFLSPDWTQINTKNMKQILLILAQYVHSRKIKLGQFYKPLEMKTEKEKSQLMNEHQIIFFITRSC